MYVFIFLSLLVHLVPYAQGVTCVFIVVALVLFGWGELKYWCISMLVISLWQLSHYDFRRQVSDFAGFSIILHWAYTWTHSVCVHGSVRGLVICLHKNNWIKVWSIFESKFMLWCKCYGMRHTSLSVMCTKPFWYCELHCYILQPIIVLLHRAFFAIVLKGPPN